MPKPLPPPRPPSSRIALSRKGDGENPDSALEDSAGGEDVPLVAAKRSRGRPPAPKASTAVKQVVPATGTQQKKRGRPSKKELEQRKLAAEADEALETGMGLAEDAAVVTIEGNTKHASSAVQDQSNPDNETEIFFFESVEGGGGVPSKDTRQKEAFFDSDDEGSGAAKSDATSREKGSTRRHSPVGSLDCIQEEPEDSMRSNSPPVSELAKPNSYFLALKAKALALSKKRRRDDDGGDFEEDGDRSDFSNNRVTAGNRTSKHLHSNNSDESDPEPVFERPRTIPFVVVVSEKMKVQVTDSCPVDSFPEAQRTWAARCGYQLIGPLAQFPPFAYKTADQQKTAHATVIQKAEDWEEIVNIVFAREEERWQYENKGKIPPSSLKSRLPLTIMIVEPDPVPVTGAGKAAKGSVAQRKAQGTDALRALLYGPGDLGQGGAYPLDRGERNEEGLYDGVLAPRGRDAESAMRDIMRKFGCERHGRDSTCYIPKPGSKFTGEHLRMEIPLRADLCRWLSRNPDYNLDDDELPGSYRRMLESKHAKLRGGELGDSYLNNNQHEAPPAVPVGARGAKPRTASGPALPILGGTSGIQAAHPPQEIRRNLWSFPIAQLDQSPQSYPKIAHVLHSLDTEAGGKRYGDYVDVFTTGFYVTTIGELLVWLHDEVEGKQKSPVEVLLAGMTDVFTSNALSQQFSSTIMPPTPLLANLMIREFERQAILRETRDY